MSTEDKPSQPQVNRPVKSQLIKTSTMRVNAEEASSNPSAPKKWRELCASDDTIIEGIYPYTVEDQEGQALEIILARVNGALFALHDQCPHRRVPLSGSAFIESNVIYCGHHQWGFYLDSGDHTLPTGIKIPRYEVMERDGKVFIAHQ